MEESRKTAIFFLEEKKNREGKDDRILRSLGFDSGKFGISKKKYQFQFRKNRSQKRSQFWFQKFWYWKKVPVSN